MINKNRLYAREGFFPEKDRASSQEIPLISIDHRSGFALSAIRGIRLRVLSLGNRENNRISALMMTRNPLQ